MFKSYLFALVFIAVAAIGSIAQTDDQVLAIAAGERITVGDLPPETKSAYLNLAQTMAERRKEFLEAQIVDMLADEEAKARKTTVEKLFKAEVADKVPDPAEAQIKEVYDANRAALGGRSLEEMRSRIVAYLRSEPEQKAFVKFVTALKTKYKAVNGKDVNSATLRPTDILATVAGKPLTYALFESKNKVELFEAKAKVFDQLKSEVDALILTKLVIAEAKSLGIEPYRLVAQEITDKLREYSDSEREELESAFRRRLIAKYRPQIMYREPEPLVFKIATEGNPSRGDATAPVTVIMFSDFQCSSCSATHPILKKVLAEYGNKVRFVVRDYPLTVLHKDAYRAALAANAAAAQGKFFEYTELLYANQSALDDDSLKKYAAEIGLNLPQFELDFKSEKIAAEVKRDMDEGKALGITGTPTIFVNGVKVRDMSADGFREAIEFALKK